LSVLAWRLSSPCIVRTSTGFDAVRSQRSVRVAAGASRAEVRRTEQVAVIGPTGWGTTLAVLFARNRHNTTIIARTEQEAAFVTADGENRKHRPGLLFPEGLRATGAPALAEATLIVLAVPSATLRANLEIYREGFSPHATVLS